MKNIISEMSFAHLFHVVAELSKDVFCMIFLAHLGRSSSGAYWMGSVRRPLSVSTFDQLYLHSMQDDLSHFPSVACLWRGIDGISFP